MNIQEIFGELLDLVDACLPQKSDGSPDMERERSDVVHDLLGFPGRGGDTAV